MRGTSPTDTNANEASPVALTDHVNAGLSIGAAACWLGTGLTDNLVLGLVALALTATLAALATLTAVAGSSTPLPGKSLAGAMALTAAALVLLHAEAPWGPAVPTIALAVGLPWARAKRPRLLAVTVSAAMTALALVLQ